MPKHRSLALLYQTSALGVGIALVTGCLIVGPPPSPLGRGTTAVVSPWLDAWQLRATLNGWQRRGFYPVAIEGRAPRGASEFRVHLAIQPAAPFSFATAYALDDVAYDAVHRSEVTRGRCQISSQAFVDGAGIRRSQATWVFDPTRSYRCLEPVVAARRWPPALAPTAPFPSRKPTPPPAPVPPPTPAMPSDGSASSPVVAPSRADPDFLTDRRVAAAASPAPSPTTSTSGVSTPGRAGGALLRTACGGLVRRMTYALLVCLAPHTRDICAGTATVALKLLVHRLIRSGSVRALADAIIARGARALGELCAQLAEGHLPAPPTLDPVACVGTAPTWVAERCATGAAP